MRLVPDAVAFIDESRIAELVMQRVLFAHDGGHSVSEPMNGNRGDGAQSGSEEQHHSKGPSTIMPMPDAP